MNINEIARLAGVSRATVSRYLNNGYVSSEKKEVIRRVIQETGYQPSSQAQTLRTKKTSLIGVILPKINSDTISREVTGISDILTRRGYQLILANTNNDVEEELKYLSLFKERQVDGVVFIATMFTRKHKQMLKDYKVPIVILGQHLDGYPCIYQDDHKAAFQVTEKLAEKGKKFAYIGVTDKDEAVGACRKKGFMDAIHKAKLEVVPERMKIGSLFATASDLAVTTSHGRANGATKRNRFSCVCYGYYGGGSHDLFEGDRASHSRGCSDRRDWGWSSG